MQLGQIYECKQKDHKGWRVELVKISANHVEVKPTRGNIATRHKAHTTNGLFNYTLDQFRRDYTLVVDSTRKPFTDHPDQEVVAHSDEIPPVKSLELDELTIICTECKVAKPPSQFRLIGKSKTRVQYCNSCMGLRRRLSTPKYKIADAIEPIKQVPPVGPTPQRDIASIAIELLELAKALEELEAPPHPLAIAVRDVLLDATDANSVYVIPAEQFKALQDAFNSVKGQIKWPTS